MFITITIKLAHVSCFLYTAKPYFPFELQDQHVDAGADLSWHCYGKGAPEVTYEWYRDGKKLVISDLVPADQARFNINNNVLTIREVNKKDEGMYQCRISNTLGYDFSSAQIRTVGECLQ